jgi:hypothetical protein
MAGCRLEADAPYCLYLTGLTIGDSHLAFAPKTTAQCIAVHL